MSLNLGDLTNEYSSVSIEELLSNAADVQIEIAEAIHSMENLENACMIQDLAKQSGSTECIHFAEELLGCSMEVKLLTLPNKVSQKSVNNLQDKIASTIKTLAPRLLSAVSHLEQTANGVSEDSLKKYLRNDVANNPFRARAITNLLTFQERGKLLLKDIGQTFKEKTPDEIQKVADAKTLKKGIANLKHLAVMMCQGAAELTAQVQAGKYEKVPAKIKAYLGILNRVISFIRSLIAAVITADRYITKFKNA